MKHERENLLAKQAIARQAAKIVKPENSVIFDTGLTVLKISKEIKRLHVQSGNEQHKSEFGTIGGRKYRSFRPERELSKLIVACCGSK